MSVLLQGDTSKVYHVNFTIKRNVIIIPQRDLIGILSFLSKTVTRTYSTWHSRFNSIVTVMADKTLFGGALSAVLPPGASDVSQIRQIPDNQEVFTHSQTDQSLIIEILEMVQEPDQLAIKTHFEDLASSNNAEGDDSKIISVEQISDDKLSMSAECSSAWYVLGQQNIAKYNEAAKNQINIHMGLFRLPDFTTDILITLNDPVNIDPDSSSHHPVPVSADRWMVEDFKQLLCSMKITDPSIFGV